MFYEEEAYFKGGNNKDRYDDFFDGLDVAHGDASGYHNKGEYCRRCGCHPDHRSRNCHCDCHSHHHRKRKCYDDCHPCRKEDKWYDCDWGHSGRESYVCWELTRILKEDKYSREHDCGCTASIRQLKASYGRVITPLMLVTRKGDLYTEWGAQHHYHRAFATVFFSVVKVNCRRNEAIMELLKPDQPIVDPYTDKVDKRKLKEVNYVVPTGERVFVDLEFIRDVRCLPKHFVKRYKHSH